MVELLVVIGIIAVLIAILLPSLAKARNAATMTQCASNLRSLGQSFFMLADRNQQRLPRWSNSSTGNRWPQTLFDSNILKSGKNTVFLCPGQRDDPSNGIQQYWELGGGYAMNVDLNRAPGPASPNPAFMKKITQVRRSAEYVLLWDGARPFIASSSDGWVFDGVSYDGVYTWQNPDRRPDPKRHKGRGNILFLDGHVDNMRNDEIKPGWIRFDNQPTHRAASEG